jgi:D-alanine-D-alanine ligase
MSDIQNITKRIFKRMGLRSIARMDFLVTDTNEVFLIEVNTNPGMTENSIVPQMINAANIKLKDVLTEVILA